MGSLQKAALSLHGMHANDRQWLLEQLSVEQRIPLLTLLDELEKLGVPREPMLLKDVTEPSQPELPKHPAIESLSRQPVENLWAVLQAEPDSLTISLIAGAEWSWKDELLTAIPAARRRKIVSGMDSGPVLPAPAFEALCETVMDAVLQQPNERVNGRSSKARRWSLAEKLKWRR